MNVYFVVNQRRDWPFADAGRLVVTARDYLADAAHGAAAHAASSTYAAPIATRGAATTCRCSPKRAGIARRPDVRSDRGLQAGDREQPCSPRSGRVTQWSIDGGRGAACELDAISARDPRGVNHAAARQLCDLLNAPSGARDIRVPTPGEWRVGWRTSCSRPGHPAGAPSHSRRRPPPARCLRADGRPRIANLHRVLRWRSCYNTEASRIRRPIPPRSTGYSSRRAEALGMRGRDHRARRHRAAARVRCAVHPRDDLVNHYTYRLRAGAASRKDWW